jgi:surfactin synthase thioesterase subunit
VSRVPLLCVPFAGAGASVFFHWTRWPLAEVTVVPVQLPGKDKRFDEPAFTDVVEAALGLADEVPAMVDEVPAPAGGEVALFGHSLGAVIAYELAHRLTSTGSVLVRHLFVSGSPGPFTQRELRATGLSDDEFLARVQQIAGYEHPALTDPDGRELLLPILRTDVEMHERYTPSTTAPLAVPITSVRGVADDMVSAREAAEWAEYTTGPFQLAELPGGHMYLTGSPDELLALFDRTLARGGFRAALR